MKKTILFKSNKGVYFEETNTKNRSRVAVRNGNYFIRDYRFNNKHGIEFNSPYVSWENLNCCNGWHYDEQYLRTAVQDNKKICSGMGFDNIDEMNAYIEKIDKDKYDYQDCSWNNGAHRWHLIDVVRKGTLSDYFNLDEVIKFYGLLGLDWHWVDEDRFMELFNSDIFELINGNKDFEYSDADKTVAEDIITGLLLGYPLESTVGVILQ